MVVSNCQKKKEFDLSVLYVSMTVSKGCLQRSRLCAGGQCSSVQPGLLKPNKVTKVENTYIDAAKQVEPDLLLGYAPKMKDALRLARLHKAAC